MFMKDLNEIRESSEKIMREMLVSISNDSKMANYFKESSNIHVDSYITHTVQTILRIRLARIADAKVLVTLTKENPVLAQKWAKYAEEEMLHDRLFLTDIESLGANAVSVYNTPPFVSTKLLQGYLYYTIEHEGPLGLLTKSYFLEYMTLHTQGAWNSNLEKNFGPGSLDGAISHLDLDGEEDHVGDVWDVLSNELRNETDVEKFLEHLNVYYKLFIEYLNELESKAQLD